MFCGTTAIHFDLLVFVLFKNTFSYITNLSKLITPLISVTRLKLNKSVEQFHRANSIQEVLEKVNTLFQNLFSPFLSLCSINLEPKNLKLFLSKPKMYLLPCHFKSLFRSVSINVRYAVPLNFIFHNPKSIHPVALLCNTFF